LHYYNSYVLGRGTIRPPFWFIGVKKMNKMPVLEVSPIEVKKPQDLCPGIAYFFTFED
jgi:hypothetical protein